MALMESHSLLALRAPPPGFTAGSSPAVRCFLRSSFSGSSLGSSCLSTFQSLSFLDRHSQYLKKENGFVYKSSLVETAGETAVSSAVPDIGLPWNEFACCVSGEWDGYGSDFDRTGSAQELPDSVVPQAMKDWGVEIRAWQSQAPTLARPDLKLYSKTIRLLPTVGCEADAATQYSVEEKESGGRVLEGGECSAIDQSGIDSAAARAGVLAFHREGSYTVAWPGSGVLSAAASTSSASKVVRRVVAENSPRWELEYCLVKEEGQDKAGARKATRVRVLQQFEKGAADTGAPILRSLSIYKENWEGGFRNGESLGGCSSNDSSFAEGPRLNKEAAEGKWRAQNFALICKGSKNGPLGSFGAVGELADDGTAELERRLHDDGLLLLPLGLWSQMTSRSNGGYSVEVGWLQTPDEAIVSSCQYGPSGELEAIVLSKQQRIA